MVLAYKHDYDKKLFRRTQIIAKLYNGAKLTHKELAEEFNVSTKTIQRDFTALVIHYPIYKHTYLHKSYWLKIPKYRLFLLISFKS